MPTICAIDQGRGRATAVISFADMDDLPISAELAALRGLRPGAELSIEEIDALRSEDLRQSIAGAAWRLLAVRSRSRQELRERLLRKRFPAPAVDRELDRLEQGGHLDDGAFARSWVAMRNEGSSPRGRLGLQMELRRKGIRTDEIGSALSEVDDAALARRVAEKRARSLASCDAQQFRRRLGAHLQRRGFSYDTVQVVVEEAWLQGHQDAADILDEQE